MTPITLEPIPLGWRFYSADASILGRAGVRFVREEPDRSRWHQLSEEDRDVFHIYVGGRGPDLAQAWAHACLAAREAPPIPFP